MSYYYPQSTSGLNYVTYPAGPTYAPLLLTAAGSTNTWGSYAEIVASSPFLSNTVHCVITNGNNTARRYLVAVATGAAAAEVDGFVAPTSVDNPATGRGSQGLWSIPWAIPASTRLAARLQSSTASSQLRLATTLVTAGGAPGLTAITSYGINTSTSGATVVDPGGSANTKGAYTQITASTSAVIQWLMIMHAIGGQSAISQGGFREDFATGAGGAEVVLIPDITWYMVDPAIGGTGCSCTPTAQNFLVYIPASTRIALRASSDLTTAVQRTYQAGLTVGVAPPEPQGTSVTNKLSIPSLPSVQNY